MDCNKDVYNANCQCQVVLGIMILALYYSSHSMQASPVFGKRGSAAWNTLTGPQKLVSNTSCICLRSELGVSPAQGSCGSWQDARTVLDEGCGMAKMITWATFRV